MENKIINLTVEDREYIKNHADLIESENFDEFFNDENMLAENIYDENKYKRIIEYFYNDLEINILDYMTSIPHNLFQTTDVKFIIIPKNIKFC